MTHWCVSLADLLRDMTHWYASCVTWRFGHNSHTCVTWRFGHNSHTCVTWLSDMHQVWHDVSIWDITHWYVCVTWRIDMTHLHVWHDSLICITCDEMFRHVCATWHWDTLICMRDMTHWHDSPTRVTWLIHVHHVGHVAHRYICGTIQIDKYAYVTCLIDMCDMTHWYASCGTCRASIHMCDNTHCYVCVTWLIKMCDMTPSCVFPAELLGAAQINENTFYITTHPYVWRDSVMCLTCGNARRCAHRWVQHWQTENGSRAAHPMTLIITLHLSHVTHHAYVKHNRTKSFLE